MALYSVIQSQILKEEEETFPFFPIALYIYNPVEEEEGTKQNKTFFFFLAADICSKT